ncbi:hypothetical protein MJO29_012822 [Puccinia striiformis f. sp. tritici]|uniref:GPI inositol-deacylase n=2 Tax=Puccinia striiformis TaxID=27350 RepID=A0A0L0UUD0_9BASI|nr:hypothetical protein Pst134EB_024962 [Puccinia striiformis f. sp. tritici]KAI7942978.1 hypothetical protein MJO29_012822 [Puccinia striiformis f. sp. tritici]KNE90638.1 hypothetical protein PSTG_15901 [Puccinia striiformis f. sp. tritici PST-78]POW22912.1 hypothetical protein PSHT_00669 [Puccinia striiformis]
MNQPSTTTTTTTISTATILSPPLSAVLRAGRLSPGTTYSQSPTIKTLRKILNQHHSTLSSADLKIKLIHYQYSLLFRNYQARERSTSVQIRDPSTSSEINGHENLTHKIKAWFNLQKRDSNNNERTNIKDKSIVGYPDPNQPFHKPKFPLVLCHGLLGFDILGPTALGLTYFRGVREALEERGCEVHVAKVPACASIEERAKTLAQFIEERLPGRTVNLIGHSMGGLDSRFLITHLRPTSFKVASLTTIGTPHRGSAFADYLMLDILGRDHLPRFLQLSKTLGVPGGGQAFIELTSEKMNEFNKSTPDLTGISYFSYGATCQPSFASPFRLPWGVVYEREGPNDGVVSLASAKWGHYMGTLENVNHAELVGWVEPWKTLTSNNSPPKHSHSSEPDSYDGSRQDPHQKNPHPSDPFHVVPFYLQVVDSLAKKGF